MKSSALSLLLSVIALAGVGMTLLRVEDVASDVKLLAQTRATVSRDGMESDGAPWSAGALPGRANAEGAVTRRESRDGAADSSGEGGGQRIRDLEERLAEVEKKNQELGEARGPRTAMPMMMRNSRFARNVDDLAGILKLTSSQKDLVSEAAERGKRRIEDLLKIPEADGVSPWDKRQERRKKIEEAVASGKPGAIMELGLRGESYRGSRVPGRNATYGEEIDRIKAETRSEMEVPLDATQKKAFEDVKTDALLGESSTMAISVISSGPGGAGQGIHWGSEEIGAEIVVDESAHEESEGESKPDR